MRADGAVNAIERAWVATKAALGRMTWGRNGGWFSFLLGSTSYDYRAAAGDGRSNAAVMACVRWAQRTFPEAPLQAITINRQGEATPVPNHALQQRLERPNPYYSGLHLMGAVLADVMLTGNGYIVKVRSGLKTVAELWWVPSSMIEPAWPDDGSAYISHYDYSVEGQAITLPVSEVVHIRQGFDPANIRKGLSDLASLYREIATDNEGANWTASLLRNGAIPGVVISPEGETSATEQDLEDVKTKFLQRFGGDQRGAPLVMRGATRVQVLSFNPKDMTVKDLRRIPEERVTAVLGIPAIVVGLGAGLDRSTFANYGQAREAAYESFIIPMQRLIAAELQNQLVPDFGDPATLKVRFDLSEVRVLQDDQNALHERARADLSVGGITLNQFLQAIGEDPLPGAEGDVRYIPNTVTVTPPDKLIPPDLPATPAGGDTGDNPPADGGDTPAPEQRHLAGAQTRAGVGLPMVLSDDDLDRLARVGPDDGAEAERYWRKALGDSDLADLLGAVTEETEE